MKISKNKMMIVVIIVLCAIVAILVSVLFLNKNRNNDDKFTARHTAEPGKCLRKGIHFLFHLFRITDLQLLDCLFCNVSNHLFWSTGRIDTPLDIQMNHIILIQMPPKIRRTADLQPGKHCLRITAPAVIRSQHVCRNRFSKTSWTAVADITVQSIEHPVCVIQQTGFIDVNL